MAIGSDDRIGRHFLFPGIGYGGSCFPKDVKALINTGGEYGSELRVCRAIDEVNTRQKELFWNKINDYFEGKLEGKKIGVWGISFKPKTDDIREAPSLYIIEKLLSEGASLCVHDPVAMENAIMQEKLWTKQEERQNRDLLGAWTGRGKFVLYLLFGLMIFLLVVGSMWDTISPMFGGLLGGL